MIYIWLFGKSLDHEDPFFIRGVFVVLNVTIACFRLVRFDAYGHKTLAAFCAF